MGFLMYGRHRARWWCLPFPFSICKTHHWCQSSHKYQFQRYTILWNEQKQHLAYFLTATQSKQCWLRAWLPKISSSEAVWRNGLSWQSSAPGAQCSSSCDLEAAVRNSTVEKSTVLQVFVAKRKRISWWLVGVDHLSAGLDSKTDIIGVLKSRTDWGNTGRTHLPFQTAQFTTVLMSDYRSSAGQPYRAGEIRLSSCLWRTHSKNDSSYSMTTVPAKPSAPQFESALLVGWILFFNAKFMLIIEHTGKSPAQ